jgi:imidazolonepropionase-like amidohydrolase
MTDNARRPLVAQGFSPVFRGWRPGLKSWATAAAVLVIALVASGFSRTVVGGGFLTAGALAKAVSRTVTAQGTSPSILVLSNFTLIDGRGGPPAANSALVATDGRITWIGPAAQLKAPGGATVQDLAGKYVMPGLINLHGHVAESDGVVQDPVKFFTRQEVEADLRLYARYGVTSVASLGTDQPLVYTIRAEQRAPRAAAARGTERAPRAAAARGTERAGRPTMARIFTAGRGFTVKDGFPTNVGNVPGVPYEPSQPGEVAAQVNELASHRPDVVKIWVDDRFGDFKKTPIEISRPIIQTAHKHNLKVVAHVFYLEDAKQLAAAGLDALVHSVRDRAVDAELIQLMRKNGTWLVPTLFREAATFAFAEPDKFLNDPFFTRGVSPRMQAVLKSPEYRKALTSDKYFPNYPRYLQTAKENLKRLADAGVRLGFGSDTGVLTRFEGYGEHWEMELMVEAGLTPMQVITAATKSSAEFLGQKDLGTLERGKWADMLIVGADPLADIKNTRRIESVYVAGNRVN